MAASEQLHQLGGGLLVVTLVGVCGCGGSVTAPAAPVPPVATPGTRTLTYTVYGKDATGARYLLSNGLASVTAYGATATTDSAGAVRLSGLADGPAPVAITTTDWYTSASYSLTISGDTTADNSASPLLMKDELIFRGVSADGVGTLAPGATLSAPASIHFQFETSTHSTIPQFWTSLMHTGGAYGLQEPPVFTKVARGTYGTTVYDAELPGYYPCTYNLSTGPVAVAVCAPTTEQFIFQMAPASSQSPDVSVNVPFLINWSVPSPLPIPVTLRWITASGPASVPVGDSAQFSATAQWSDGTTTDITSSASWVSLQPSIASVSATGRVTGLRPGIVSIGAQFNSMYSYRSTIVMTAIAPPTPLGQR